jgi:hypothetical protein
MKPFANALAAMVMMGGMYGFSGRCPDASAAEISNDPDRPKTKEDLERMEAARLKRERKKNR